VDGSIKISQQKRDKMEYNEKKGRIFGRKVMCLINVWVITIRFYAVLFGGNVKE